MALPALIHKKDPTPVLDVIRKVNYDKPEFCAAAYLEGLLQSCADFFSVLSSVLAFAGLRTWMHDPVAPIPSNTNIVVITILDGQQTFATLFEYKTQGGIDLVPRAVVEQEGGHYRTTLRDGDGQFVSRVSNASKLDSYNHFRKEASDGEHPEATPPLHSAFMCYSAMRVAWVDVNSTRTPSFMGLYRRNPPSSTKFVRYDHEGGMEHLCGHHQPAASQTFVVCEVVFVDRHPTRLF